jgi:hypothetical protein
MYRTQGYPVDIELRARKARERAESRRRKAAALKRLLTIRLAHARA